MTQWVLRVQLVCHPETFRWAAGEIGAGMETLLADTAKKLQGQFGHTK